MKKLKVMTVFGTRPDAIKMAPLVKELDKNELIESCVCVTAQHRQMLDQVLNMFEIKPHYDLNIMQDRQTLEQITVRALEGLSMVLDKEMPDIVLVHGDTTTCFIASLAAFYKKISVGHVEAGLRTFDIYSPFPEEMNRKLTGAIAQLHFAPTIENKANLMKESISDNKIYVTGNTVIDALKTTVKNGYAFRNKVLKNINHSKNRIITLDAHRRENLGEPLENIYKAVRCITNKYSDVEVVCNVHLNPAVQEITYKMMDGHDRIHLIDPVDVQEWHNLISISCLVMTDSGGVQEEAPSLGKPVLVLRNETERHEAVSSGTVKLVGTDEGNIFNNTCLLLDKGSEYNKMAKAVNPYGDGNASSRIVSALLYEFGLISERPQDFMA